MRLKIKFKKTSTELPINNQHIVTKYVHDILGKNNEYHDGVSNYCISTIVGNFNPETKMLNFDDNPCFYVTSEDDKFLSTVMIGILKAKHKLCDGFEFEGVDFISETINGKFNEFNTLTPVLLKDETGKEVTIRDEDYSTILEKNTIKRLSKYNPKLDLTGFKLKVRPKGKKKFIPLKGGKAPCNVSVISVDVTANREVSEALYNIGLGKSTGYGFGTIYKRENYHMYAPKR